MDLSEIRPIRQRGISSRGMGRMTPFLMRFFDLIPPLRERYLFSMQKRRVSERER
jgi:hypothetical protein